MAIKDSDLPSAIKEKLSTPDNITKEFLYSILRHNENKTKHKQNTQRKGERNEYRNQKQQFTLGDILCLVLNNYYL